MIFYVHLKAGMVGHVYPNRGLFKRNSAALIRGASIGTRLAHNLAYNMFQLFAVHLKKIHHEKDITNWVHDSCLST